MNIVEVVALMQKQFDSMCLAGKLFRTKVAGDDLWITYLLSFKDDPIFRSSESSVHNCNNCKNFIRRYGNVVAITPQNEIISMFDVSIPESSEYYSPIKELSNTIKSSSIISIFVETLSMLNELPYGKVTKRDPSFKLGLAVNHHKYTKEELAQFPDTSIVAGQVYTFNHFNLTIPAKFIEMGTNSREALEGDARETYNVFKRGLEELSLETLELVRDLAEQNSILNGETFLPKLKNFIQFKKDYLATPDALKDNWLWRTSFGLSSARFRNEVIGTLCIDIQEGKALDAAILSWNKKVDPTNYKKAAPVVTTKQREEANSFIVDNGYEASFARRAATLADIDISEIVHVNNEGSKKKIAGLFANVATTTAKETVNPDKLKNLEEVSIGDFMRNIVTGSSTIEVLLENRLANNFVALHTSQNIARATAQIFNWNNPFSWTYINNLAGKSELKQAIKDAGGNVEGFLRCSLSWNEDNVGDLSDLDLWCIQPDNQEIGYSTGYRKDDGNNFTSMGGQLDLDDRGIGNKRHLENIYFVDSSKLSPGRYQFQVVQYAAKNSKGFKVEIDVDGTIYSYIYNQPLRGSKVIAIVTINKDKTHTIQHLIPVSETVSIKKEVWGLESNLFHKVNLVCNSPNHWGDNNVGFKHIFFFLEGCAPTEPLSAFHSENLIGAFQPHRRAMEALSQVLKLEPSPPQLAGLGFNSTVKDSIIVKIDNKRIIKVIL